MPLLLRRGHFFRAQSWKLFSANSALLKVEGLEKRFGGITALTDYDVEIRRGELVGLTGPNGAGKTTVFNLLSGVLNPAGAKKALANGVVAGIGYGDTTFVMAAAPLFQQKGVPMKGVSIIGVHDGKYKVEEVWFPKQ